MPWESTGGTLGTPAGLPRQQLTSLTPELDVGESTGRIIAPDTTVNGVSAVKWAVRRLERDTPRVEVWRAEARKADAFFAGDQVSEVDRQMMDDNGRPIITLNATQRFIRIVDGIERRVPIAIYYVPRDPSDMQAATKAELRTKCSEWVNDRCGAVYEKARAKHDRNISGMGWTDTHIDRSQDPAGIITIRHFSNMQAIWPQCSRENLDGTDYRAREKDMAVERAILKWPQVASILAAAAGGEGVPKDYPIKADLVKYVVPWTMTEPTNKGGDTGRNPEEVRITDFQYAKPTEGYYFKDPILDKMEWLPSDKFNAYSRRLSQLVKALPRNVEKVTKDTYWRLFLLNRSFLLEGPTEMPIEGFSLNCITGDWDAKRKIWYGMIRMFIDPQLMVDKYASSAVEIIGSQSKAGWLVEVGAASETQIEDLKKTGSRPGSVNQVKRNALTEKRIIPKPVPQVPAGTVALLEFGLQAMQTISGITESILAPEGGTGVGLRQRLSIGLLLLAAYFDSSLRFERKQGEITQQYMRLIADDRWVRIGGPFDAQVVQLAKEDFEDMYDTTVDDTQQDPSLRQLWEERVVQLAPTLIRTNNFIPEVLDFMRLPVAFVQKLKQAIQQNAQQQMQMRMQGISPGGRGKQRTTQEIQADVMYRQSQAALAMGKTRKLEAESKEIGMNRMHTDMSGFLDALLESHRATIEQQRLQMEQQDSRVDHLHGAVDMYRSYLDSQQKNQQRAGE